MKVGCHVLWTPGLDKRRDDNALDLAAAGWRLYVNKDMDPILDAWTATLESRDSDEDWTLLATDDAVPYHYWEQHIESALAHSPSPILSLCHFARAGRLAADKGFAYGVEGLWGIVVAFRGDHVQPLIDFRREVAKTQRDYPHTDGVTYLYARRHGLELAYTARALFDHAMEWGSTLGHHGPTEQRKPGWTIFDPGPSWDTPGVYRHKLYIGQRTRKLEAALGT